MDAPSLGRRLTAVFTHAHTLPRRATIFISALPAHFSPDIKENLPGRTKATGQP
jgi:hypothetical protein